MRPEESENLIFSRSPLLPSLYLYQDLYLRKKLPNRCHLTLSSRCVGKPLFRPLTNRSGARSCCNELRPGWTSRYAMDARVSKTNISSPRLLNLYQNISLSKNTAVQEHGPKMGACTWLN